MREKMAGDDVEVAVRPDDVITIAREPDVAVAEPDRQRIAHRRQQRRHRHLLHPHRVVRVGLDPGFDRFAGERRHDVRVAVLLVILPGELVNELAPGLVPEVPNLNWSQHRIPNTNQHPIGMCTA